MKLKSILSIVLTGAIVLTFISCSKAKNDYGNGGNGGNGGNEPPGDASSISINGMSFPSTTTVKKGTTVKWTNNDGMAHTVTSDDGTSFNSGNLPSGSSFSYTANTAGTFPYHCAYHSGMKGKLVVTN